jgi:hypothetical protein
VPPESFSIKALTFAEYAAENPDAWIKAIGCRLIHRKMGAGIISEIINEDGRVRLVRVNFDEVNGRPSQHRFAVESFRKPLFLDMELPAGLDGLHARAAARIQEWERREKRRLAKAASDERKQQARLWEAHLREVEAERRRLEVAAERRRRNEAIHEANLKRLLIENEKSEAKREFHLLKKKYKIDHYQDNDPTSILFIILKQIDAHERLLGDYEDWLRKRNLYIPLALYYEYIFDQAADPWHAVKASRYWRNGKTPIAALTLADRVIDSEIFANWNARQQSAMITSHGGALRDLSMLDQAELCAKRAILLTPYSYYPYKLLGAIYFRRGKTEEGDDCFEHAIRLGSTRSETERSMRRAIMDSEEVARRKVALYLLNKDANRYSWARRYLGGDDSI